MPNWLSDFVQDFSWISLSLSFLICETAMSTTTHPHRAIVRNGHNVYSSQNDCEMLVYTSRLKLLVLSWKFLPPAFLKFILASTVLYSFQNNFTNIFFLMLHSLKLVEHILGSLYPRGMTINVNGHVQGHKTEKQWDEGLPQLCSRILHGQRYTAHLSSLITPMQGPSNHLLQQCLRTSFFS